MEVGYPAITPSVDSRFSGELLEGEELTYEVTRAFVHTCDVLTITITREGIGTIDLSECLKRLLRGIIDRLGGIAIGREAIKILSAGA